MRHTIMTILAVLAWQALDVIAIPATTTDSSMKGPGLVKRNGPTNEANHKRSGDIISNLHKRKPKTITFADFKCQESYNGLVDNGICKTLGVPAPDLADCAGGAALWTGSAKTEKLKSHTSQGEYTSGKCAVSVYNQSKKTVKYSRAALALWWSAASNACVYPGTGWDSAYCTVLDDKGQPSGVILVMSREEHNKDFKANVISGPTAD